MPTVAQIRPLHRLPELRLLVLDDGRRLHVDVEQLARCGLAPGEPLDAEVLAQLESTDAYLRARRQALRLLASRPRTVAEMRERLRRRGIPDVHVRAVLRDLTAAGYLDDLAFARQWIAGRAPHGRGVARLRWELREKGAPAAVIEQAIREAASREDLSATEERAARELVARRARAYAHLAPEARLRRLAGLLERRGFASRTIARLLRSMRRGAPPDPPDDEPR